MGGMAVSRWMTPCLLTLIVAGCGDSDTQTVTTTAGDKSASESQPAIYSQAARLKAGSTVRLLKTPTVKVLVTCNDEKADVSVANRRATADAVVSSYEGDTIQPTLDTSRPLVVPMAVPDIQTWTIAPFSAGETQPTTVTVGVRAVEPGTIYDCAVMAQAVSGAPVHSITK
jgi:hypothetical protein